MCLLGERSFAKTLGVKAHSFPMTKLSKLTFTAALSISLAAPSYAVLIFSPGGTQGVTNDTVFGGQRSGTEFVVGSVPDWPGVNRPQLPSMAWAKSTSTLVGQTPES